MGWMKGDRKRLSAGEVELLSVLWERGPQTLAQVHQSMGFSPGYTTIQTRLNRLVAKGYVSRSEERPARYQAAISRQEVAEGFLEVLLRRVTGGRVAPLVAHLLESHDVPADELAEVRRLVEAAERRCKGGRVRRRRERET